jgi:sterol carrier protein 2
MAPKSKAPCYVLGVGMTKFIKPRGKVDYTELGFEAGVKAMVGRIGLSTAVPDCDNLF